MTQRKSTRRRFALFAGSIVLTGVAGCSESGVDSPPQTDDEEGPTSPTQSPSPTETPAENATNTVTEPDDATVVEMITDNQGVYFDPKGILVEPGTTVRFVNESGNHGTTAYHPVNEEHPRRIPTDAEPWNSDIYAESGRHFEVTVEVEGVYDYYCPPHESMGMVGRIVVGEPQDGPGTSPPDDLPPGAQEALPTIEEIIEKGSVPGP